MFNFLKKQQKPGQTVILQITGMHCVSCAMNIDGTLEDTEGVISATTDYARAKSIVTFDEKVISLQKIKDLIKQLGYETSMHK